MSTKERARAGVEEEEGWLGSPPVGWSWSPLGGNDVAGVFFVEELKLAELRGSISSPVPSPPGGRGGGREGRKPPDLPAYPFSFSSPPQPVSSWFLPTLWRTEGDRHFRHFPQKPSSPSLSLLAEGFGVIVLLLGSPTYPALINSQVL